MLEAMARGLPCIGSAVGGIPELLHEEDLVTPDNPAELAEVLKEVLSRPERIERMSARNLQKAQTYSAAILSAQRQRFFRALKELTSRAQTAHRQDLRQPLTSSARTTNAAP